jgi:paraquat-inducible protein A
MPEAKLIACHECDLLQRETPLPLGGEVCCVRCGGELYRSHPQSLDRSLAYTLAALTLFVIANLFPVVGLVAQGQLIQTTLFGTVHILYVEDMRLVAVLVFVTTILMPGAEIAAMCYLMLPLRLGWVPRWFAPVFRVLQAVRPWGMVEVFMLGIIVALAKLAHIASVVPGIAMWCIAGLIFLRAAAVAKFDARMLWARASAYNA